MNLAHRLRLAAAAALTVPALASCAFSEAATDQIYTPAEGVNARDGQVDVLNILVVAPEDGAGTLVAGLVNNDQAVEDTLVSVRGVNDAAGVGATVDGTVTIPAAGITQLADTGSVTLSGGDLVPGRYVELELAFANAEPVTVTVPVLPREGAYADVPLPPGVEDEGPASTEEPATAEDPAGPEPATDEPHGGE